MGVCVLGGGVGGRCFGAIASAGDFTTKRGAILGALAGISICTSIHRYITTTMTRPVLGVSQSQTTTSQIRKFYNLIKKNKSNLPPNT